MNGSEISNDERTKKNCTASTIDEDDESHNGRDLRGRIRFRRRNRRRDPCKRRCRECRHCRNFILSSTTIIGINTTLAVLRYPEQFCVVGIIIMAIDGSTGHWVVVTSLKKKVRTPSPKIVSPVVVLLNK